MHGRLACSVVSILVVAFSVAAAPPALRGSVMESLVLGENPQVGAIAVPAASWRRTQQKVPMADVTAGDPSRGAATSRLRRHLTVQFPDRKRAWDEVKRAAREAKGWTDDAVPKWAPYFLRVSKVCVRREHHILQ